MYDRLQGNPRIRLYTPRPEMGKNAPVLSLTVEGVPSEQVGEQLAMANIAVRAGLHCAPLAHTRFGTLPDGTVRLAPSAFSTAKEVEQICKFFIHFTQKTLHPAKNML